MRFGYTNYLFDLDGTITDPQVGIIRCYEHALTKMGEPPVDQSKLSSLIGPPIRAGFASLISDPTPERIELAVAHYRERFSEKGIYEVELTPGARETLVALKGKERKVFVVTSKVQEYAEKTLAHFDLLQYVDGVYGSNFGGTLDDKADILRLCLGTEMLDPLDSIMIGDRMHDFHAADSNGVASIGVRCGFAAVGELEGLSCIEIIDDLRDLIT